jgi:hypothetical protein
MLKEKKIICPYCKGKSLKFDIIKFIKHISSEHKDIKKDIILPKIPTTG